MLWLASLAFSFLVGAQEGSRSLHIEVEVPIEKGDRVAAKEASRSAAFSKAIDSLLPANITGPEREARLKSSLKYIKSFRTTDEVRSGDNLKVSYEIEVSNSVLEGLSAPQSEGPPALGSTDPREVNFEIVFAGPYNAAEVIESIKAKLSLKVISFRLTRPALLLKVESKDSDESLTTSLQNFFSGRAKVNLATQILPAVTPVVLPPAEMISPNAIVSDTVAPNAIAPNAIAPNAIAPNVLGPQ